MKSYKKKNLGIAKKGETFPWETESLSLAAQNNAIKTNYIGVRIEKTIKI